MADWHSSREYRLWRISVIRRDKVCQVPGCGGRERRAAHHMNSGTYFPEERFDINNGVTLCGKCHMNFHNNFKRSYREKCTKYDFENFISLASYFHELYTNKCRDDIIMLISNMEAR
jgi:hypothetical protein